MRMQSFVALILKEFCVYNPWNVLLFHFCVCSPSVKRAFIVHSFAFSVQRSQSVQRFLTVRSPIVHKTFSVHSAFRLHCHSEVWSWKINIKILERSDDKEEEVCFIFKTWFVWGSLTTNYEEFIEFLKAWARSNLICYWSSKTRSNFIS